MHAHARRDTPQLEVSPRIACSVVVTSRRERSGQEKSVDIHSRVPDQPFYKTKREDLVPFQELYLGSFKELEAMQR